MNRFELIPSIPLGLHSFTGKWEIKEGFEVKVNFKTSFYFSDSSSLNGNENFQGEQKANLVKYQHVTETTTIF